MTTYSHGSIVVVDFPATSGSPGKRRPSVVIYDSGDADIVIAKLTTKGRSSSCDVALNDWSAAGLRAPSVRRLHKLLTIEKAMVRSVMGSLSANDRVAVAGILSFMFGNW